MNDRFEVKLFYGRDAIAPAKPGQMAIHTWNIGEHSRDMEVNAGRRREDIGRVDVLEVSPDGKWATVYDESTAQP